MADEPIDFRAREGVENLMVSPLGLAGHVFQRGKILLIGEARKRGRQTSRRDNFDAAEGGESESRQRRPLTRSGYRYAPGGEVM